MPIVVEERDGRDSHRAGHRAELPGQAGNRHPRQQDLQVPRAGDDPITQHYYKIPNIRNAGSLIYDFSSFLPFIFFTYRYIISFLKRTTQKTVTKNYSNFVP
jgi:hypothetical protein